MVKLYTYWRSTTAWRVRIALHLKGVAYDPVPVNLVAGDQRSADYMALNPIAGVPTLATGDGAVLTQSMAILEYLETVYPDPPLLPPDPVAAAQARAAAMVIATDIHPINNLKVGIRLKRMDHSQEDVVAWMNHWMTRGFTAFQALLPDGTDFCFGDAPGLADICLIPQLYNAHRWGCDLAPFARLTQIERRAADLPAFSETRPETQPDAT